MIPVAFGRSCVIEATANYAVLETFVSEDHKFRLRALLTPEEPTEILL